MSLEQIICHAILAVFIVFLIKDAEIFSFLRNPLLERVKMWKVSRRWNWLGWFLEKLLSCPFCLSFWTLLPSLFYGLEYIPFTSPVLASIAYNFVVIRKNSEKIRKNLADEHSYYM